MLVLAIHVDPNQYTHTVAISSESTLLPIPYAIFSPVYGDLCIYFDVLSIGLRW